MTSAPRLGTTQAFTLGPQFIAYSAVNLMPALLIRAAVSPRRAQASVTEDPKPSNEDKMRPLLVLGLVSLLGGVTIPGCGTQGHLTKRGPPEVGTDSSSTTTEQPTVTPLPASEPARTRGRITLTQSGEAVVQISRPLPGRWTVPLCL